MRVRKAHVVTFLVVGGLLAGATSVYLGGRALDRRDRELIVEWERRARGPIASAREQHEALGVVAARLDRPRARASIQRIRDALDEARIELLGIPIPSAVEQPAAAFLSGVGHDLRALGFADDAVLAGSSRMTPEQQAEFDDSWTKAGAFYAAGDRTLIEARCGAHLPDCDVLPTGRF